MLDRRVHPVPPRLDDNSPECNFKACSAMCPLHSFPRERALPPLPLPSSCPPIAKTACIFIVPLVDKYRALLTDGPAGPEAALIRNLVVPTLDSGATSLV